MLRDFRSSDQERFRALVNEGLRERWGDDFDPGFNPDLDNVAANYVSKGASVVVAEENGQLVGSGILVPEAEDCGRILRMSVHPAHRRRGIARRIVAELVRRAARAGMSEVRVCTDTPWASAIGLYRSCGFDEVGRDETDTHFVMRLPT